MKKHLQTYEVQEILRAVGAPYVPPVCMFPNHGRPCKRGVVAVGKIPGLGIVVSCWKHETNVVAMLEQAPIVETFPTCLDCGSEDHWKCWSVVREVRFTAPFPKKPATES